MSLTDEELNDDKKERFHHIVAKLLYIAKREIPDIDLAVSFLYTRVRKSSKGDWKNYKDC